MRTQINLYNFNPDGLTDGQILKALTKIVLKQSEQLVCETYDDEPQSGSYFYDGEHLGFLEQLLDEICEILQYRITYKPHLKLISQMRTDIHTGTPHYLKPKLVEDVINDFALFYFTKDEKVLERNEQNCKYHYSYIVRKLRPMSNKLAKILDENEIESVFNRYGW